MSDRSYTFTRGIDTVHVAVDQSAIARSKFIVYVGFGGTGIFFLLFGIVLLPLLPVGIILLLTMVGKASMLDQIGKDKAELKANQAFSQMESERWRAVRALRA